MQVVRRQARIDLSQLQKQSNTGSLSPDTPLDLAYAVQRVSHASIRPTLPRQPQNLCAPLRRPR